MSNTTTDLSFSCNGTSYAGIAPVNLYNREALTRAFKAEHPESLLVLVQNEDVYDLWVVQAPAFVNVVEQYYIDHESWAASPFRCFLFEKNMAPTLLDV